MKQSVQNVIKIVLFLVVLFFVLLYLGKGFSPAVLSEGRPEMNFFDQKENSFDVLFVGNCHSYSTFIPSYIENDTGMRGFDLGVSDLSAENCFLLVDYALRNQSPKVLVLETFPFLINKSYITDSESELNGFEAYCHAFFSDVPSMIRLEYLKRNGISLSDFSWFYYLFEVAYFHDRWSSFSSFYSIRSANDNGWIEYWNNEPLNNPDVLLDLPFSMDEENLDERYLASFLDVLELAEKKGVKVILVTIPYTEKTLSEAKRISVLKRIAAEKGIPYIDFSSPEMIQLLQLKRGDMRDKNHLNLNGAEKISGYMAEYLNAKY